MRKIVNPLMVTTRGREDTTTRKEGLMRKIVNPLMVATRGREDTIMFSDNRYRKEFVFIFKSDFVLVRRGRRTPTPKTSQVFNGVLRHPVVNHP